MNAADLFDARTRRRARDRAARNPATEDFVRAHMLTGIEERLSEIDGDFANVLDIGARRGEFGLAGARIARLDPGPAFAAACDGVLADEHHLPFADGSFDLVVSAGVLDQVGDLPGALLLIRRALRPGGLFIGAFMGAGTLDTLRRALREAEPEPPAPRLHPQIDVRAAGDLLGRAGFLAAVADTETLWARYRGLDPLIADLRAMAATNMLRTRAPLRRDVLEGTRRAFATLSDADGKTRERFDIVYMTGRAPSEKPTPD